MPPSVQHFDSDSDYDARPEAGRSKSHLDSDDSNNGLSSSAPKRHHRFSTNDTDDSDNSPIIVEEIKQKTHATKNLIRQPTAFITSNPSSANSSQSGPSFRRAPIHSTVSADGTSMFCVEGYVNSPELSAGSSGGLSQGHGPYKSLFRATPESRSNSKAPPLSPDAGLHILAEAAQSPESAFSPVSAASPAPVSTSTKLRKASPLITSSPASSVPPPDIVSTTQIPQNASTSHVGQPFQAKQRSGVKSKGKGKAKAPSSAEPSRSSSRADVINSEYGRPTLLKRQPQSALPTPEPRETQFALQSRSSRKNKTEENDVASVPPPPALSPNGSYDYGEVFHPEYEHSTSNSPAVHQIKEQSLSPPPSKTWVSPGSSPATAYHYPGATCAEPSPLVGENSRHPITTSAKPRMLTLLIEDRRHGTDELAEVRVPLKAAHEGHFWADAKQVCAALQGGPSRIDGPAKVLTMRGKYRQTFLRISAEGEETNQSANLKVNSDKTLPIIVESTLQTPTPTVSSITTPISMGPSAKLSTMAQPLTPISSGLDLDGKLATPFHRRDSVQRVGGAKKRKRDASLTHLQPPILFNSPDGSSPMHILQTSGQAMSSSEHNSRPRKSRRNGSISSFDDGYRSDSPPGAYRGYKSLRKDLGSSTSHSRRSGYETDQPLSSEHSGLSSRAREQHHDPDRKVGSRLQLPPNPADNARSLHDKIVSFLQNEFMQDAPSWNEFSQNCTQIRSLSNAMLLRIYWYAQGRLDDWVGAWTPERLKHKKVEIKHVLGGLGVTEDWYRECNDTLSLAIAYGEGGERCEDARAVAASRDRTQKKRTRNSGPTDLLVLLRQVHEEYCERVNARREGSE